MKCFRNYADKLVNPLFIWYMNPDYDKKGQVDALRPAGSAAAERVDGSGLYDA